MSRPPLCCLLVLLPLCSLASAETPVTWEPHAHPAVLTRTFSGYTRPLRDMVLAAEYAGRVASMRVDAGDRIVGDEPAVQLDDTLATLSLDSARSQEAGMRVALEGARQAQRLAQREASYRDGELERIRRLSANGQAPEQELDLARFQADTAAIAVERAAVGVAEAENALDQAGIATRQAAERLQRHALHAPAGWTVVERLAEPGTAVVPQQGLLRLADTRTLVIVVALTENELRALRAAEPIAVRFPQHPGTSAPAHIRQVSVVFDPVSRKRQVELSIAGTDAPEASGGMEAHFTLAVPDPSGGMLIPETFLLAVGEQTFVIGEDGQRRAMTVLRRQDGHVVVASDALPRGLQLIEPEPERKAPR